jgi:hypothetical protein
MADDGVRNTGGLAMDEFVTWVNEFFVDDREHRRDAGRALGNAEPPVFGSRPDGLINVLETLGARVPDHVRTYLELESGLAVLFAGVAYGYSSGAITTVTFDTVAPTSDAATVAVDLADGKDMTLTVRQRA